MMGLAKIGENFEKPHFFTSGRLGTPDLTPKSNSAPKNTSSMSFWAYLFKSKKFGTALFGILVLKLPSPFKPVIFGLFQMDVFF